MGGGELGHRDDAGAHRPHLRARLQRQHIQPVAVNVRQDQVSARVTMNRQLTCMSFQSIFNYLVRLTGNVPVGAEPIVN
jgi:hypothetical protein